MDIPRRSFLQLMFGAGIWATIARWFSREATKRVVAYNWGRFTELTPHGGIYTYKDDDGVERIWGPINAYDRVNFPRLEPRFTTGGYRKPWEYFKCSREEMEELADCRDTDEGLVRFDEWSNLEGSQEEVDRITRLLARTGCKVNFRINYPCKGLEAIGDPPLFVGGIDRDGEPRIVGPI